MQCDTVALKDDHAICSEHAKQYVETVVINTDTCPKFLHGLFASQQLVDEL